MLKVSVGIYKKGRRYCIDPRDDDGFRTPRLYFESLEEAKLAREMQLAVQKERRRIKASRPAEERRKENLRVFRKNSEQERGFVMSLSVAEPKVKVMNDSTKADVILQAYEDPKSYLPIQVKTTGGPRKNEPNSYEFTDVDGYGGMLVVLWRCDAEDGWVFDGDALCRREIKVTLRGKNARLAKSGEKPLNMREMIQYLKNVANEYTPVTEEEASWSFRSRDHFKERCTMHLYKTHVDPSVTLPEAQNGPYDLVGASGERIQLKTASYVEGRSGLLVHLKERCGMTNGVYKRRAYASGSFDVLVVYYIDWKKERAHMWKIPVEELEERDFLRKEESGGKQTLYVFLSGQRQRHFGRAPDLWSYSFYTGSVPLQLPDAAEREGANFLKEIRKA
jgi:hypothetical protein